jgi:hypothetical protein
MRRKLAFMIPIGILAIVIFAAIGGYGVRFLWNWLVPEIIGWREITFWQALGLLALCRMLFGGLGIGGRGHSRRTPEERQRFREAFRRRFGSGPPASPVDEGGEPGVDRLRL